MQGLKVSMVYKNNKRSNAITKVYISAFYQNLLYSKLNNHHILVVHIPSVMSCAMGLLTSLSNNLINRRYYQLSLLFAYNFSFSQRRAMNTTLKPSPRIMYLEAFFPRHPKTTPGQETRRR